MMSLLAVSDEVLIALIGALVVISNGLIAIFAAKLNNSVKATTHAVKSAEITAENRAVEVKEALVQTVATTEEKLQQSIDLTAAGNRVAEDIAAVTKDTLSLVSSGMAPKKEVG